jgi:type IV pilus assembly protein PilC
MDQDKQANGGSKGEQPISLKDQIISRIREQDQATRDSGAPGGSFKSPAGRGGARYSPRPGGGFFRPSLHHMAAYARELSTLIEVGIPLLKSLQILGERSTDKKLRRASQDLARRVEEGQTLSTAMEANPSVFSSQFVGTVRVGEAAGILDKSMGRLADMLERRLSVKRRVIGALAYPAVAIVVEIVIVILILVYALPKLAAAYPDQSQLPALTKALLGFSAYMQHNWYWVVAAVVAVIVLFGLFRRSRSGRYMTDKALLHLPVFGSLARKLNVEQFTRTLGNLTSAGIPLIDALAVTADTAPNAVVSARVHEARDTVEKGGKMETALRKDPIFDPMVVDMVMVGDEAGALDTMLGKIADNYDSAVDASLRTMTALLEPLLIVMLGIAVGFVAVACFQPYVYLVKNPALMVE